MNAKIQKGILIEDHISSIIAGESKDFIEYIICGLMVDISHTKMGESPEKTADKARDMVLNHIKSKREYYKKTKGWTWE